MSGDITGGRSHGVVRPLRPRTVSPMSIYMGTLSTPQRTRARTAGCPRKSLSTVPRQRGEVRRWRTSVGYADHVAPPRVAGSYALLRPWVGPEAVCSGLARMGRTVGHFAVIILGPWPQKSSIKIILNYNLSRNARYIVRSRSRKL